VGMSHKVHHVSDAEKQRLAEAAPRTWQRMLSGRRLNLVDPSPLDVEIADIALALSRTMRWNGQTSGAHGWSVAQHAELVVHILRQIEPRAPASLLMAGLLHDGPEYVTHDLITPLKHVVGDVFKEVEDRLQCAINVRFGLPARLSTEDAALVKKADVIAGATEAVQLAGFTDTEVKRVLGMKEKPLRAHPLTPLPSKDAEAHFLELFAYLQKKMTLECGKHLKS